jgi:large subunit ribosomal protein L24
MPNKLRIKTDDTVVVIAGKDRGKSGRVIRTDPAARKVWVEGLNMVRRHQKPLPGRPNMEVGVIEKEAAIHVSNVALADPKDGKPTRVGVRRTEQGLPMRYAKRSGTEID